ncbi:helix-turn-helix domain-containing protein [Pseudoalteromonas 'SMAR']|uniref:helix-turn-helix domain-containing protein n=1 Tax=Pseudoalteromonas 'SMAR' TaxID=3416908 RepID=UPI003AF2FCD5
MTIDKLVSEGIDVDLVIQRLFETLNVNSDRALSKEMGLSLSAVNQARKRGSLPWEGVVNICKTQGISLDWLFDVKPENSKYKKTKLPKSVATSTSVEKETVRSELLSINAFVEEVMDQVVDKTIPASRMLEVRKALAPILIDAAIEYDMDKSIVAAVARSTLRLV